MRKARYKDRAKLRGESEEKNGELPFYPPQTERKGMSKRERERERKREVQGTRRTRRDRRAVSWKPSTTADLISNLSLQLA